MRNTHYIEIKINSGQQELLFWTQQFVLPLTHKYMTAPFPGLVQTLQYNVAGLNYFYDSILFIFFISDTYDAIVMSAAFGKGDVPEESIYEIVRLAKSGKIYVHHRCQLLLYLYRYLHVCFYEKTVYPFMAISTNRFIHP